MNATSDSKLDGVSRIPCLDGLRACSILLVLLGHLRGTHGFSALPGQQLLGDVANLGVRCFFIISGFLITHLLLKEFSQRGSISLRAFYIRRTFRIFPAFYTFFGIIVFFTLVGIISIPALDLACAGTYTINFLPRKAWEVGHLWSLAVEEQFYLLWPICLVALGIKRARTVALAALLLAPACRIGTWYLLPEYRSIITKAFPTICDTIATGCLLACFRERLWKTGWYRALLESRAFVLVPAVVLISNMFASHTRPDLIMGQSIRNVGIAICIDWCLRNAASWPGRFLNWGPMVWIGALSYSLYLWQQIFLNRNSNAFVCSFPLNVMLAFSVATLSYYLVERPCLRARVKLFPNSGYNRATTRVPSILRLPEGVVESTIGTAP
jgi:peptidoglycan/LPS O-acetylase OafA/YrhL